MIEFSEDTIGIWFVGLPKGDWLASVFTEDDKPCLIYRFRYHVDDKAFDSDDEKNWYRLAPKGAGGVDKLVETVRFIAGSMAAGADTEVYELMREDFGDTGAFMEEFRKAPFVTWKEEKLH